MEKRERFFGLHFDFHADNETEIGTRTTPEDIGWFVEQTKPDFVQCDCKGHPGNASYPTKVGHAADNLRTDNLRVWCDTLKKYKVPVYVHYSGVVDQWYTKHDPENAAWDEAGNPRDSISLFGDYCENYMIPQLKELIEEYGIDGAWIDGDEWAVKPDHSPKAKPYFSEDMTPPERNQILRKAFYRHVQKYVDALHEWKPDFKISSNWLYTGEAPDRPEVNIDFISGDYKSNNSVHAARFDTRCIANQGKPWDLMAWSFYHDMKSCFAEKSAVQLMQEAAVVLAMGGGFQLYIQQNADGSARHIRNPKFREISEFVHKRRLNYGKKTKAQVATYYSATSAYAENPEDLVFQAKARALKGITNCVLDAQYTCAVVLQHQWESFDQYEIIIVPEWKQLTDVEIERLTDYARRGGKLVITGADLAVRIGGYPKENIQKAATKAIADKDGSFIKFRSDFVDLGQGDGTIYSNMDLRDAELPGWYTQACGAGSITYIPFHLGEVYGEIKNFILQQYLKEILHTLAKPHIVVNEKDVDITVQETETGILINLINMRQGRHSLEYCIYDHVPEIYDVELTLDQEYRRVDMPLGEDFEYHTCHGKTVIKLKKLEIHSILTLE